MDDTRRPRRRRERRRVERERGEPARPDHRRERRWRKWFWRGRRHERRRERQAKGEHSGPERGEPERDGLERGGPERPGHQRQRWRRRWWPWRRGRGQRQAGRERGGQARPSPPRWLRHALRAPVRTDQVAQDLRLSWQAMQSSFHARREAASGTGAWRSALGAGSVLLEVVLGPEPPAASPAQPPRRLVWLRTNWTPVLWVLTVVMFLGTVAWLSDSTQLWEVAIPIVGVLLVLPLGLAARTPLRAWRFLVVVAVAAPVILPPAGTVTPADGPPWPPTLIFVALYVLWALAVRADLRLLAPVWLVTSIAIWWSYVIGDHRNPRGSTMATIIGMTVLLVIAYLVGTRQRMQRELAKGEQRARAVRARSALLEERARIARELHDVVAHHMSVIAVRAETAPFRMPGLPEVVKEDMAVTSSIAREALAEMRRLLGVLRGAGSGAEHAPQPGLDRLGGLVASVRGAGLDVDLRVLGEERPLPGGVELSAFRIVQEALSNVLRHAPGARATVEIAYEPGGLRLRVENEPPPGGPARPRPGGIGHGIIGMRERATMLGGRLSTGPTEDGGYLVEAVLPQDDLPHPAGTAEPAGKLAGGLAGEEATTGQAGEQPAGRGQPAGPKQSIGPEQPARPGQTTGADQIIESEQTAMPEEPIRSEEAAGRGRAAGSEEAAR